MNSTDNHNEDVWKNDHETGLEVAIIGMAGRFPGSSNLDEMWDNLENSRESLTFFSDEQLEEAGIGPETYNAPNYVRSLGVIENCEYFDAAFFGYTPTEALYLDPQKRVFHEVGYHALEDAGYDPFTYDQPIGVFGGARDSSAWSFRTRVLPPDSGVDFLMSGILSSSDHLSMSLSYALNLKGPSFMLYTACSTSLVAVHLGCQAVLSGECTIALAGGASIDYVQVHGYFYREGMLYSPDGHTRSFDHRAKGLVGASGCGIVVLKLLEDAIEDRDHIYAVVKGSAINNDGNQKIGYTAPSILGQEALLRHLYDGTGIETESIGLVECHGSATPLGDPVEVEALRRAFHKNIGEYCALGSIKSNFGHADCAAGVASLIKVVLSLVNRRIPALLNFEKPNPKIDLENSPFYVNTETVDWKNEKYPLRGGVNSLGLGGTNAHVIVQEAPPPGQIEVSEPSREYKVLPLSAKTAAALDNMTKNLAAYLEKNPGAELADVAYSLQKGRAMFSHRRAFACKDTKDALQQISNPDYAPVQPFYAGKTDRPLVFMFSGQGSEYIDMGRDLYHTEPSFREDIDSSFDYLTGLIGEDIKHVLYPVTDEQKADAEEKIHRIYYTQPVKFIFEYAYARLLMRWGLKPSALIGYSFGEYIVACLAGVISLEDGLKVLMKRGEILERAEPGYLLSVSLPEKELELLLEPGVYLAGVNTENLCLVAGTIETIERFEKKLEEKNIDMIRYRVICGGHSPLMDPILPELEEALQEITFNKPKIPWVCGLTGTFITPQDATDPSYFTRQLRQPVRFSNVLGTLFEEDPETVFLEVGPGTGLVNFVKSFKDSGAQPDIQYATMVRHYKDPVSDHVYLMNRLGLLWSVGKVIDWDTFYGEEKRRRVPLPGYPFDQERYWIDTDPMQLIAEAMMAPKRGKNPDLDQWFYAASWKTTIPQTPEPSEESLKYAWLVFTGEETIGGPLVDTLRIDRKLLVTVSHGESVKKIDDFHYQIDYRDDSHYEQLFGALKKIHLLPATIIHMGNLIHRSEDENPFEWNDRVQDFGFYSLLNIARAIGRQSITHEINIEILSNGLQKVAGEPLFYPEKATLMGPVKNIPQEYPNIKCRAIDIVPGETGGPLDEETIGQLTDEFLTPQTREQVVAFRGDQRFVQTFVKAPLESPKNRANLPAFRQNGVYLIIGGLGGIGLTLGAYLVENYGAKLVLTSRSGLPPKDQWKQVMGSTNKEMEKIRGQIGKVMDLEAAGGEVVTEAVDAADLGGMTEVVDNAGKRFGPVNGVIHSAYVADGKVIDQRTRGVSQKVFAPKINGTLVLEEIFSGREPLDFFVTCSSLAAIFGPVGQVAYTAGNAFQDAFARHRNRLHPKTRNVSINWCGWAEVGGAVEYVAKLGEKMGRDENFTDTIMKESMMPSEGTEAFVRIMNARASQVMVSVEEISYLVAHLNTSRTSVGFQESLAKKPEEKPKQKLLKRPNLKTAFAAPRDANEEALAEIWRSLFGLETVGVNDDFFELGGDSLKAMTVASRIHKELDVKVPVATFFSMPTIEELARYIVEKGHGDTHMIIPPAEPKEYYPVSSMQERLFRLHLENPDSITYNIWLPHMLEGELDRDQLEKTFIKLFERHEIYRTSMHMVNGTTMQKIHDQVDFKLEYHESSKEELDGLMEKLKQPFDLTKAPLLRGKLIRVEENMHVLMFETHHIAIDGSSAGILSKEFLDLYGDIDLPPLRINYKDFSQWQHDRFEGEEMAVLEKYWLEQFKEPVVPMHLPTDFPKASEPGDYGEVVVAFIDQVTTQGLRDMGQETGATTFMMFMAAYGILLHKYSKNEDLVVGFRIANRPHSDLARLIGRFSNELGFRSRPRPDLSFSQFLEEVKATALGLFKHQEYPFERLPGKLDYPWITERTSMFDTMVVYNNIPVEASEAPIGQLNFRPFGLRSVKIHYDLFIQATETGNVINLNFQYPTDLFKKDTIKHLAQDFLKILAKITENPEATIEELITD